MAAITDEVEPLLTPAEVAAMFRVDPKTVTRWAKAGKLTSVRTLGGHRRYLASEVKSLLDGTSDPLSNPARFPAQPHYQPPVQRGSLPPLPPPPATPGSTGGLPSPNQ